MWHNCTKSSVNLELVRLNQPNSDLCWIVASKHACPRLNRVKGFPLLHPTAKATVCCQSIKGMTAVVVTHPGRGNSVKPIRVLTLIDFNGMSLLKGINGKDTRRSKHSGSAFRIWSCFSSAASRVEGNMNTSSFHTSSQGVPSPGKAQS